MTRIIQVISLIAKPLVEINIYHFVWIRVNVDF